MLPYESEESLRHLIKEQGRLVTFYRAENEKLRKENTELKACLRKDLTQQTVAYREIEDKLDALEKPILDVFLTQCKKLERALSYDEALRFARNSPHPALKTAKTETITRRIRRLKEKGLLTSPKPGYFYPNIEVKVKQSEV